MKPILPFLILATCSTLSALPAADPPCMGAWQEDGHPGIELRFEPQRVTIKDAGRSPQFFVAEYAAPGTFWFLNSQGGRGKLVIKVTGNDLTIVSGAENNTFHRAAKLPADLEIAPTTIPDAKPVSDERKTALSAEADQRLEADQAVRTDPARKGDMAKVDADNTAWIKTVITEVGWPDAGRFGRETSSKMFMFVQHSGDLALMLGVLPCIEKDMPAKVVDPQDFAELYDRVQMYTGRPQRYGTQFINDEHRKPELWLLEDKAKVEQLRASIDLIPLALYLQLAGHAMGTTIGFMDHVRFDESAATQNDSAHPNQGGTSTTKDGVTAKQDTNNNLP